DRELVAPRGLAAKLLHVLERRAAIGLRLARAEEIEVGAVEDVDGFRHGRSCRRDRGSVPLYRDPARKGEAEARERHDIGCRARRLTRGARARKAPSHNVRRRGGRSSKQASAQQAGLPQRAPLTFSLSVFKPTAPTRTSLPTT